MRSIGMSGCYDVFHDGHRHILRKALNLLEEKSSKLIVAVNSDRSVRETKGKDRPIDSWHVRSANIMKWCNKYRPSIQTIILGFDTEKELENIYNDWNVQAILHGDDITDVHKVTGFPKRPAIIVDRGFDKDGERTSSSQIISYAQGY